MKNVIFYLMLLFLISCKKEDAPVLTGLLKTVSFSSAEFPDYSFNISYNNKLQIEKLTNINENIATSYFYYHYDDIGNLTHIDDESGIVEKYIYNTNSQLIVYCNRNFKDTINYEYDPAGHMILERNKYWYLKYEYDNNNNRSASKIYNNSDSLLAELYHEYYNTPDPMQHIDPAYFDKNILSESYSKAEYEVNGSVTVSSGKIISGTSSSLRTARYVLSTSQIELSQDKKILKVHKVYKDASPDLWIQYEFY